MSEHHDPRRMEAAAVLLAKEANDLNETIQASIEWNERIRRRRVLRSVLIVGVALIMAMWLNDTHVIACHDTPIETITTQRFCNLVFPLGEHVAVPGSAVGAESVEVERVVGMGAYLALVTVMFVLTQRDSRRSARYFPDDNIESFRSVLADDHWEEDRQRHWTRVVISRGIEFAVGVAMAGFGAVLLAPKDTFAISPSYDLLASIAPEVVWGGVILLFGGFATWASYCDDLILRRWAIIPLTGTVVVVALGFILGPISTGTPIYTTMLAACLWSTVQVHSVSVHPL